MSRRIQLPEDPVRAIAAITAILNEFDRRIETVERALYIETDLTRPPVRVGSTAVVGGQVYVAVGLSVSDWTLVS